MGLALRKLGRPLMTQSTSGIFPQESLAEVAAERQTQSMASTPELFSFNFVRKEHFVPSITWAWSDDIAQTLDRGICFSDEASSNAVKIFSAEQSEKSILRACDTLVKNFASSFPIIVYQTSGPKYT